LESNKNKSSLGLKVEVNDYGEKYLIPAEDVPKERKYIETTNNSEPYTQITQTEKSYVDIRDTSNCYVSLKPMETPYFSLTSSSNFYNEIKPQKKVVMWK